MRMADNPLRPLIDLLSGCRLECVERLRAGDHSALSLKHGLDGLIRLLEACEHQRVGLGGDVLILPTPVDPDPLGEYRIVRDVEAENRDHWREVARALPGDVLIRRQPFSNT